MWRLSFLVLLFVFSACGSAFGQASAEDCLTLNNEAAHAMASKDFPKAIEMLTKALKLDPNNALARENLITAYNNYGLLLASRPEEALKQLHHALFIDPDRRATLKTVARMIRRMRLDPNAFTDRIKLAEDARSGGDLDGAVCEYRAALSIKNDPATHTALGDTYCMLDRPDHAIAEYKTRLRSTDDAAVEVKLAQAYLSKRDVMSGEEALGKAVALKPHDLDVLETIVASWGHVLSSAPPIDPSSHIGLGEALELRGDPEGAAKEYQTAIRFSANKHNPLAERLLAKVQQQMQIEASPANPK